MALEMFTKKGSRSSKPTVTITKSGQIGLNSACLIKYFTGMTHVLLYCDKEKKTIGIKPILNEQDNSFKISFSTNKVSGNISGHSFLKFFEIDFENTRKFTPKWNETSKILIIESE